MMTDDTRLLLEECESGCKMAVQSMKQVEEYIKDKDLLDKVVNCRKEHERLGERTKDLLKEAQEPTKEPPKMASTMSWITTEMKLMVNAENHQIAKIMMDGCNMGIQSVSEYLNKYTTADSRASELARDIVDVEERFMKEMKHYI